MSDKWTRLWVAVGTLAATAKEYEQESRQIGGTR
jgi:hypothetical protein